MVNSVRLIKKPGLYGMGGGLIGHWALGMGTARLGSWQLAAAGWPGLLKVRKASGLGDERDEARRLRAAGAGWQTKRLAGRIKA
jgi:hypothetical protein